MQMQKEGQPAQNIKDKSIENLDEEKQISTQESQSNILVLLTVNKGLHKELIRKREEISFEIRKQNREESLKKRRNINQEGSNKSPSETQSQIQIPKTLIQNQQLSSYVEQCLQKNFTFDDFRDVIEALHSNDVFKLHFGVIGIRRLVSVEKDPPIQLMIDSNIIPIMLALMTRDEFPHLQMESAWTLTNIASGSSLQTQVLVDKGSIPLLVKLLHSKYIEVAEQAIWALGNIAGDSVIFRDCILTEEPVPLISKILMKTKNKNLLVHGIWALSNLCRGKPAPKFKFVYQAIPVFAKILNEEDHPEMLMNACWAMTYLSEGSENRIQMALNQNILNKVAKLLSHPFVTIMVASVRIIGNIVTGNESQTDAVIEAKIVPELFKILDNDKKPVRREICWVLSNITAGTPSQVMSIVGNPVFVNKLRKIMITDDYDVTLNVAREATWILTNAIKAGTLEHSDLLVNNDIIQTFIELLNSDDIKTVCIVLEALKVLLEKGEKAMLEKKCDMNPYLDIFIKNGGSIKLQDLQMHRCQDIYEKTTKIIEAFFDAEEPF